MNATNPSITRRLLWFIAPPLIVLTIVCAGLAAKMASQSVNDLHDQQMKTNAGVLLSFVLYESYEHEYDDDDDDYEEDDSDELLEIAEAINSEHGLPVNFRLSVGERTQFVSSVVADFPKCAAGFSELELSRELQGSDDWHCYSQRQPLLAASTEVTVEIFESQTQRQQAIRSIVLATFSPLLLLPLLVAGLTYQAVSWAMRSLRKVSADISDRSVDNLTRLPLAQQPLELLPVAKSVNHLLDGIERSLKREKQFTDDAAHELRTPVTSIKMLEQLLRRENKDPLLTPYLNDLRDSVDHSGNLIDQLLGFARLQSAKSLPMHQIHLGELVHTELGLLAPQLTAKNLAVKFRDEKYNQPVTANETALALLVRNILSNACKFSATDGVVYVYLTNRSLVIEDDGPGIDSAHHERIFDRFYRAPDAKQKPGSGLGLALAKWVADTHNFELISRPPMYATGASIVLMFDAGSINERR